MSFFASIFRNRAPGTRFRSKPLIPGDLHGSRVAVPASTPYLTLSSITDDRVSGLRAHPATLRSCNCFVFCGLGRKRVGVSWRKKWEVASFSGCFKWVLTTSVDSCTMVRSSGRGGGSTTTTCYA